MNGNHFVAPAMDGDILRSTVLRLDDDEQKFKGIDNWRISSVLHAADLPCGEMTAHTVKTKELDVWDGMIMGRHQRQSNVGSVGKRDTRRPSVPHCTNRIRVERDTTTVV